jgi:competence protein ComEC
MPPRIPAWKEAPFVRLLIPLAVGIMIQWHAQFRASWLQFGIVVCILAVSIFSILTLKNKFRFQTLNGISINLLCIIFGCLLVFVKDIRHSGDWFGHASHAGYILVKLEEPLQVKPNSFKALGTIQAIKDKEKMEASQGKVILYFQKDQAFKTLSFGSQILIKNKLQEIKNTGNPGSFDYKQYCLFQGITHQAYLTANDFVLLNQSQTAFETFIFDSREWVIRTIKKYIDGEKEQGLASALLIGYKNDLDKSLVQSYTNTGVVHIIAISGLHLGLIYWLLLLLTQPLAKNKWSKWLRLIIILSSLWLFSILSGAQPSVMRSAVMFSFLALGEIISRQSKVYNNLALSAFVLLCYDPFWLWDAGFQLSYAAVISISAFYKPIYNWFYFTNKGIDFFWKLVAITLAAQLLTLPVSIYHFHQLPLLFLITNIVAVPLSSVILFGEIFLCAFFFITPLAQATGKLLHWLIYWMNSYIEQWNDMPFALWKGLSITPLQATLLVILILSASYWLLNRKRHLLYLAVFSSLLFMGLRSISFIQAGQQKRIIVYNVPKLQAIDIIQGMQYNFIGDSELLYDNFNRNFHLQPSRLIQRVAWNQEIPVQAKNLEVQGKYIFIIDGQNPTIFPQKTNVDLLILSKNPRLYISKLIATGRPGQVVIDGSVPDWKARLWQHDCDSLHIPCFNVTEKGAYILEL